MKKKTILTALLGLMMTAALADEGKVKVLFDCDIGSDIDDSLALAYLLCEPRCELMGVTTVSGEPHLRAAMVSAMCRNVGRTDVPIHVGIDRPLATKSRQPTAAQARKLANWPHDTFRNENTAVAFLRQTIRKHPGEIVLLAVGPMTNIAALFAEDPEIPSLLKGFSVMCGRFFDPKNAGEWNGICDPVATAIVYGTGTQAKPVCHRSYGLDVTTRVRMGVDEARKAFANCKVLAPVADFVEVWFQHNKGVTYHDPLSAVCVFHPEICGYAQARVTVPLTGERAGWTVVDDKAADKPHTLANEVDAEKFFAQYFSTVRAGARK